VLYTPRWTASWRRISRANNAGYPIPRVGLEDTHAQTGIRLIRNVDTIYRTFPSGDCALTESHLPDTDNMQRA
jgi:hypothetical protein